VRPVSNIIFNISFAWDDAYGARWRKLGSLPRPVGRYLGGKKSKNGFLGTYKKGVRARENILTIEAKGDGGFPRFGTCEMVCRSFRGLSILWLYLPQRGNGGKEGGSVGIVSTGGCSGLARNQDKIANVAPALSTHPLFKVRQDCPSLSEPVPWLHGRPRPMSVMVWLILVFLSLHVLVHFAVVFPVV
jgi:hypothetical protein